VNETSEHKYAGTCPDDPDLPTNQPTNPGTHPPTRGFAFLAKQRNYKHTDNWHLSHQIPFCGFYLFTLDSKKKMGFQEEEEHFFFFFFAPTLHKTHKKRMCKHQSLKSTTAVAAAATIYLHLRSSKHLAPHSVDPPGDYHHLLLLHPHPTTPHPQSLPAFPESLTHMMISSSIPAPTSQQTAAVVYPIYPPTTQHILVTTTNAATARAASSTPPPPSTLVTSPSQQTPGERCHNEFP